MSSFTNSPPPTNPLPQSAQDFVGFVIFCLRQLSVAPTPELRTQVRDLFTLARGVVNPAEAFPGWILNVGVACFSTLAAEGEIRCALRVLDEVEFLDAEVGGNVLKTPRLHGRLKELRTQALKLVAAPQSADTVE